MVGRKRTNRAAAHGRASRGNGLVQYTPIATRPTRGEGARGPHLCGPAGLWAPLGRARRGGREPKRAERRRRSPEEAAERRFGPRLGVAMRVGLALAATGIASAGLGRRELAGS